MYSAHPSPATICSHRISTTATAANPHRFATGRRIVLLIALCLLLPSCVNNNDSTMAALSPLHTNAAMGQTLMLQSALNYFSIHTSIISTWEAAPVTAKGDKQNVIPGNTGETSSSNDLNAPVEQRTIPMLPVPGHNPALTDEPHADMHDSNEEEEHIHISFSRLMRVVLILLFAVLII